MLFVVSSLQHILRCKIKNKNRDCKQNRYENQIIFDGNILFTSTCRDAACRVHGGGSQIQLRDTARPDIFRNQILNKFELYPFPLEVWGAPQKKSEPHVEFALFVIVHWSDYFTTILATPSLFSFGNENWRSLFTYLTTNFLPLTI